MPAAPGRTTERYVCPDCQHVNYFYIWSWAGNGVAKCTKCGLRISWWTRDRAVALEDRKAAVKRLGAIAKKG